MRAVISIARGDGRRTVTTYSNENGFPNGKIWSKSIVVESDRPEPPEDPK
jgi:hypothetical protein